MLHYCTVTIQTATVRLLGQYLDNALLGVHGVGKLWLEGTVGPVLIARL